jgi:hypothetical protein
MIDVTFFFNIIKNVKNKNKNYFMVIQNHIYLEIKI